MGQLTGFPFPAGAANVYRVEGRGGAPAVQASGFTNIVDIARGKRGVLYVLQISSTGLAGPDGTQSELAAGQLQQPTGIAVAKNGDVYVANEGGSPTDAKIVRIPTTD